MADVVNLNRFRKKKAKEEKEKRAETNRRLHGRTAAERQREEAQKKRMEKVLEGAFLVRERVDVDELPHEEAGDILDALESATAGIISLSEFSQALKKERSADEPSLISSEKKDLHEPNSTD